MKQLVEFISKELVDNTAEVKVEAQETPEGTLLLLSVAREDAGKVIGRDGRTIQAIRTLASTLGQKRGVKVRLELQDDKRNGSPRPPSANGEIPEAVTSGVAPVSQLS